MTQQRIDDMEIRRDRPVIEITSAMIEAGSAAVQDYHFDMSVAEAAGIAKAVLLAVLSYQERVKVYQDPLIDCVLFQPLGQAVPD